ncbi:MAG: hypothetical protein OEW98_12130 [Betaproteobacteria bacterium]|nr:hypothetical protein [Betaproteobacteria bacterium]
MRRSRLAAVLLVPVLALLVAAAPPLVDPPPISVPAGLTAKEVERAIVVGVAQRGWVVSSRAPGSMEATLHLRTHVARVGITYDLSSIQIKYLDSENLDYEVKKGVPRIHRNYLKWVDNIVRDITVQLQAAELDRTGT